MTLLALIRNRPRNQYPKHWRCPANQTECGQSCFMREACTTRPAKVRALIERLDSQTAEAMVEYVTRLRA